MKMMTKEEQKEFAEMIAQSFAEKLQQSRSVSDTEHWDHHQWIAAQKQKEIERAKFWADLRDYLAKRGAWGVLVGLLVALGFALKAWIRALEHGG
jgi:hypothetical protein